VVTSEALICLRRGPGLAIWAKQNSRAGSASSQRPARYRPACGSWSALAAVSGVLLTRPPGGVGAGDDLLGVCEQRREPVASPGRAARQVVLGSPPAVERELAARAARAGGELDELGGVGVPHPELDRPVARRWQRAGEDAAVGEPHAAA
jgi:hypothetical protein